MHAFFNTGITGTARDDIKLSAFFYNNNVMNTLQLLLVTDKNAGLQRSFYLLPGFDSDKISLFLLQCSFSSIFISICLHGIPPVFFDKFRIFFSGGAGIHQFQRQLRLYFGLNWRIVDLNKAGAAILPLQIDTNMLQPFFPCC